MENKFLEAIRKLVEYDNREFLRSFQLRAEIIQEQTGNINNININDDIIALIAPFQTIGFLESSGLKY